MRASDVARLSQPYDGDPNQPGPGPAAALGVDTPLWLQLETTILDDLRTEPPYGIAWWAPHPGTARRILIADQLYACTHSTAANLIEASLHWLEFLDFAERESDRLAYAVKIENGEFVVKAPRRQSPFEDVGLELVRLHVAGMVRALAGALDCMAGSIIGVAALPTRILRADFGVVRSMLRKIVEKPSGEGQAVQAAFGNKLETVIASSGADSWLDWALAFRNMLVHRGRRIEVGQFVPRQPMLYGPDGKPVPRVSVINHLPRDPGRSDVEVFLQPTESPVLTEDAAQTLRGLLKSTTALVETVAGELLALWKWRRANPDKLNQPAAQWPNGVSTDSISFAGYAPGSFKYSPSMMMTHPVVVHRMRAAALDDKARAQWNNFD
jgi:hypothetical protein